jgi:hypothetical protein
MLAFATRRYDCFPWILVGIEDEYILLLLLEGRHAKISRHISMPPCPDRYPDTLTDQSHHSPARRTHRARMV